MVPASTKYHSSELWIIPKKPSKPYKLGLFVYTNSIDLHRTPTTSKKIDGIRDGIEW